MPLRYMLNNYTSAWSLHGDLFQSAFFCCCRLFTSTFTSKVSVNVTAIFHTDQCSSLAVNGCSVGPDLGAGGGRGGSCHCRGIQSMHSLFQPFPRPRPLIIIGAPRNLHFQARCIASCFAGLGTFPEGFFVDCLDKTEDCPPSPDNFGHFVILGGVLRAFSASAYQAVGSPMQSSLAASPTTTLALPPADVRQAVQMATRRLSGGNTGQPIPGKEESGGLECQVSLIR